LIKKKPQAKWIRKRYYLLDFDYQEYLRKKGSLSKRKRRPYKNGLLFYEKYFKMTHLILKWVASF